MGTSTSTRGAPHPAASGPLVVCALSIEALVVAAGERRRHRPARARILRMGMGVDRAAATVARLDPGRQPLAVAGVGGALDDHHRPGVLVVADRVLHEDGRPAGPALESAAVLADDLRDAGFDVEVGAVITTRRLIFDGTERRTLTTTGAVAVDMESAPVVAGAGHRPMAVLRAISDTPAHPMWSPATVTGGVAGLRALYRAAPILVDWAVAAGTPGPPTHPEVHHP